MPATIDVTDACLDGVYDALQSLKLTGHDQIEVDAPVEFDKQQDGLYVYGGKKDAIARCAFVHNDGDIEWLM
jgi:hypothetical protein